MRRTVPTAMLCAASSIHHSPLSHSDQGRPVGPTAAAAAAAAVASAGSAAGATPRAHSATRSRCRH